MKTALGSIGVRDLCHVLCLWTLRSVGYLKLYLLPLDQRLIAVAGYRAVMNKDILLAGLLNKSIAFGIIKPFDQTYSLRHSS